MEFIDLKIVLKVLNVTFYLNKMASVVSEQLEVLLMIMIIKYRTMFRGPILKKGKIKPSLKLLGLWVTSNLLSSFSEQIETPFI